MMPPSHLTNYVVEVLVLITYSHCSVPAENGAVVKDFFGLARKEGMGHLSVRSFRKLTSLNHSYRS